MKFRDILISVFFLFVFLSFEYPCLSQALILSPERAVELAFANHAAVKNSELRLRQASLLRESSIEIPSMNFNYYYGQLHSIFNDKTWSVSQSLGSIPSHIINLDLAEKKIELSKSELEVNKRELQMKVRSAYYGWIYRISWKNTLNEQMDIYSDFLNLVRDQFEHGEIGEQVLSLAVIKYAGIENEMMNAEDEEYLAENALKQLIQVDDSIIPEKAELEMLAILPSTDSSRRFSADAQLLRLIKLVDIRKTELKLEKWKLFPELHAGYFSQEIDHISGLHGWQAGLSFPLWFLPQNAAIKQARIETEIAENDLKSMQFVLDKTIDKLLTELNRAFRQISYAEKYQLKQADQSIQSSENKFHKEEIGYLEYLQAISDAMKIKTDFLEALDSYNQIALQLEYFVSNP